jgi:hypothetical protein
MVSDDNEFDSDPKVPNRPSTHGEYITEVHSVNVFSHTPDERRTCIINYGNPIFTADDLREIADEVDEYYSEPTFEDRINEIADEYGLEIDYIEQYDRFPADAKLLLPDDFDLRINLFSDLDEIGKTINFYDDHVNVEEDSDE